jgi:hypothetical protein
MSKKHLEKYVDGQNWVRRLFNQPALDVNNLSAEDVAGLLDRIESDLSSPENLTMDGELRGAKLRARQSMILGAQAELNKLVHQPG